MDSWIKTGSLGVMLERGIGGLRSEASIPITSFIHEHETPHFVAPELERLYSNLFSALPQIAIRNIRSVSTYVAFQGKERKTIFLFKKKGAKIHVLNEGINLDEEDLLRFAQTVFTKYRSAKIIQFHAVDSKIEKYSRPYQQHPIQQHPILNDIVLALPDSTESYLARLGKSTRSYLNRYLNKLRREHPSFQHQVLIGDEIEEDVVRELVGMHKARMTSKDKVSIIDDKRMQEILHLCRRFGFVVVARVDGKVCGGTINYRVGDNYFLETVAHDSAYNEYRIGTLCSYLTVCECIARGGKEYHFLWGEYDYKYRLGGVRRELSDLYVYRSRLHILLGSDTALAAAAKCRLLPLKIRLKQTAAERDTFGSRIACQTLNVLRKGRQLLRPYK